MNIIQRNFFRLLRSGVLNEYESLEPMSAFKWNRLVQMIEVQGVSPIALKGIKNHTYDENANIPKDLVDILSTQAKPTDDKPLPRLSNPVLNKRLHKIQTEERHHIDASMTTLDLLNIIVDNAVHIFNKGIPLSGITELGRFLRTRGDKVDFVKLEKWLSSLHLQRMAQLEGSILIAVFGFEQAEIPFVRKEEPAAYNLTIRTLNHTEKDTSEDWNFRQNSIGFVSNNSTTMRRNLRRGIRYFGYAPIETTSNYFYNFVKSLSEIEE
ncbi:MAG: hypothetical protein IJK42_12340 [Prevotella sp.]|nr:hypothetical protein [Prevotella sp.]MBQ6210539.1 hypothetical protein [Prevotella sp.]